MKHIYFGLGKGKTTAAVGQAIRSYGARMKVAFIQFDKNANIVNEGSVFDILQWGEGNLTDFFNHRVFGVNRVITDKHFRFKNIPEDFEEAKKALEFTHECLKKYDVVVADEALACVMTKLLTREDVEGIVKACPDNVELILTGHEIWPELLEMVDLATEMKPIKHYFEKGIRARKGIDY